MQKRSLRCGLIPLIGGTELDVLAATQVEAPPVPSHGETTRRKRVREAQCRLLSPRKTSLRLVE